MIADYPTYMARCDGCGAIVAGALSSNPSVPYYVCGRVGNGRCLAPDAVTPDPTPPNVVALDDADQDALGDTLRRWAVAWTPRIPVIGLCDYQYRAPDGGLHSCNATAVDGRCLDHDDGR